MAATQEIKLVSQFARFVAGDIKGGAAAHAYRTEIIRTAIEQAYKGNYSPITEAMTLTEGKAKKARAYAAGFAALGPIGDVDGIIKVAYVGPLNAHDNADAREAIRTNTDRSTTAFFAAFDIVMAEKAEKKAPKTSASAGAGGDETTASVPTLSADEQRHAAAVALDDSVTVMETNLRSGLLTGEQVDRITDAALSTMTPDAFVESLDAGQVELLSVAMLNRLTSAQLESIARIALDKAGFEMKEAA